MQLVALINYGLIVCCVCVRASALSLSLRQHSGYSYSGYNSYYRNGGMLTIRSHILHYTILHLDVFDIAKWRAKVLNIFTLQM